MPTVPGPAPWRNSSPEELGLCRTQVLELTALASLSGRPQITLPFTAADGAPVGFSLLGWRNGDEVLLDMADELLAS
jgi:amidase